MLRASQALHVTNVLSFPNVNEKSVLQSLIEAISDEFDHDFCAKIAFFLDFVYFFNLGQCQGHKAKIRV